MAALEGPRPYFIERLTFDATQKTIAIPRLFLGAIEPDSLRVMSCSIQGAGAAIVGGKVKIEAPKGEAGTVTVIGIRRGLNDWHYRDYTDAQRLTNNRFYSLAHA
jgi:hypothetical protein